MRLNVTPEIERLIEVQLRAGKYSSAEEVVTAALFVLESDAKHGDFAPGEWDRLLEQGERSGQPLDGEAVLAEFRALRENSQGR